MTDEADEWDALSLLTDDLMGDERDAILTTEAYSALFALANVLGKATEKKGYLLDPAKFMDRLSRLNQIARDFYATQ